MTHELTVDAVVGSIETVTAFADGLLAEAGCPMRAQMQLNIAIDELFSNIAHYAYGEAQGRVTVRIDIPDGAHSASITFIDTGKPFDPLGKEDPDVTLSAEKRKIGGLGIFMVKQSMDDVLYEFADGQNRLTVVKTW